MNEEEDAVVRERNHHEPPQHLNLELGAFNGMSIAGAEAPGRIFFTTTHTSSPWTRTLVLCRAHTRILALLKSGAWAHFSSLSLENRQAGLGRPLASSN
jgi:hypothetical protein